VQLRKFFRFVYPLFTLLAGAFFFLTGGLLSGLLFNWANPMPYLQPEFTGIGQWLLFLPAGLVGSLATSLLVRPKMPGLAIVPAGLVTALLVTGYFGLVFLTDGEPLAGILFYIGLGLTYGLTFKSAGVGALVGLTGFLLAAGLQMLIFSGSAYDEWLARLSHDNWASQYHVGYTATHAVILGAAYGLILGLLAVLGPPRPAGPGENDGN